MDACGAQAFDERSHELKASLRSDGQGLKIQGLKAMQGSPRDADSFPHLHQGFCFLCQRCGPPNFVEAPTRVTFEDLKVRVWLGPCCFLHEPGLNEDMRLMFELARFKAKVLLDQDTFLTRIGTEMLETAR